MLIEIGLGQRGSTVGIGSLGAIREEAISASEWLPTIRFPKELMG
jgi:hypothetical protein